MNIFLHQFLHYFENVIDPAASKAEALKTKRRNSKTVHHFNASPDCLHIRASVRKQDNVRRNPAP